MSQPTADLKACWFNVIRRLQAAVASNRGFAIISIQIVVNETGEPVFWTEPGMVKLEPQGRGAHFLAQLISGLDSH